MTEIARWAERCQLVGCFLPVIGPMGSVSVWPTMATSKFVAADEFTIWAKAAKGNPAVNTAVSNVLALTMILPTAALTCEYELFGAMLELL